MRIEGDPTLGQYTYDPFGRRVSKTVSGVTTWFHYDDTGLLAEYSASGQLLNEYQYRPGSTWMTNPLFKRDGATGKVHYYYNSHLGQPLKLFDKAGKITWAARSQAFGQTTVFVNETENNLRFPGQYEDGETGLYYNLHRYYEFSSGRYIQRDPLSIRAGLNTYIYVGATPLSFSDPYGLIAVQGAAALVGGVLGGIQAYCARGNAIDVGVGIIIGAASGVIASLGFGPVSTIVLSAASGGGASVASQIYSNGGLDSFNGKEALASAAKGAAFGVVAFAGGGFAPLKTRYPAVSRSQASVIPGRHQRMLPSNGVRALDSDIDNAIQIGLGGTLSGADVAAGVAVEKANAQNSNAGGPGGCRC